MSVVNSAKAGIVYAFIKAMEDKRQKILFFIEQLKKILEYRGAL